MKNNPQDALYSAELKNIDSKLNQFLSYKKESSIEKRKKINEKDDENEKKY